MKINTAHLVLDVKSCYDRISPPIALLSLRRQGAPQSFTNVMFHTIDQMIQFIPTSYGDSRTLYAKINKRFYVLLQGDGAGSAIWAIVSTPPLLDRQRFGVKIPSSDRSIHVSAFAFVDITDSIHKIIDYQNMEAEVQQVLSVWKTRTTGGALVPEKCTIYTLVYIWGKARWLYLSADETPAEFKVKTDNNQLTTILRAPAHQAIKSL
jgi:hypothetical protein